MNALAVLAVKGANASRWADCKNGTDIDEAVFSAQREALLYTLWPTMDAYRRITQNSLGATLSKHTG